MDRDIIIRGNKIYRYKLKNKDKQIKTQKKSNQKYEPVTISWQKSCFAGIGKEFKIQRT
jgi:hypothetical protein